MRILLLIQCLIMYSLSYGKGDLNVDSLKLALQTNQINNEEIEVEAIKSICEYYQYRDVDSTIKYAKLLESTGRKYKNADGIFNGSLYQIFQFYFSGEFSKCLNPMLKAYKEIKPLKNTEVEVFALNRISQIYSALKKGDSADHYNNIALQLSLKENYILGLIMCYSELGGSYYFKQILDSAMLYYLKGEKLCNSSGSSNNYCASIHKMIAKIHVHKDEYDKALTYYLQSQKQFSELGNTKAYYTTNTRIANVMTRLGKYEMANQKLDSSYTYFKSKKYYKDLITCLFEMSNLAIKQENYTKNLSICKEIEEIYLSTDVKQVNSLDMQYGKAYFYVNEYDRAIVFLENAYSEAHTIKNTSKQENVLFYLSKAYSKVGKHAKAIEYYEKYIEIHEINEKLKNNKYTSEQEAKFQSEKKDQEIKLLKANQLIDEQKRIRKSNLLMGGVILSLLTITLLFVLFRNKVKTTKKLKEIDKLKTNFFENISHEFRTPLTLIKLPLSQAIQKDKVLDLSELNLMHNNASRLQNLIEDLLSLSELEAGKMKIKKSEQDPLVQTKTLCSQFDSYAESKGVNYHKVIERNSLKATYDKTMLDKVLANLISNAIKYSEVGGEVQVAVAVVDQKLVVKVSDQGEGISPEDQEKIFERFYRVEETDEGKQGSGIGLALVKKLIEINSGTIEVTSKIKEGSTFTATIPLENMVILPFEPIEEKPVKTKRTFRNKEDLLDNIELSDKPKLLITEDNKELLEYISNLFKEEFQIINASNGEEGMQKALEFVPDFIISDWMMPKKNGLEFCEEVKTNSVTSHIPFLLLTAKSMVEDKIKGYETGADAYFSKPFNFSELQSRINGLLKQRKLLFDKYHDSEIEVTKSSNNSLDVKFWDDFSQYLKNNIRDSKLNATIISEHMGMSRMQLHRKLTALTGQNLSTFIKNQRMNLACELLKDKSLRVSDVCYEVGYEDQSTFSRAFKKEFKVSPTHYRENL